MIPSSTRIRIPMFRLSVIASTMVVGLGISAGTASAQSIAIEGATLRTPDGDTENITIIVSKGKVSAMGAGLAVPAGATRIDGKGKVVTAGLVATNSKLGLVEINAVDDTNEGQFGAEHPVHAAFQVIDGYNPNSIVIDVARNGGITSTISIPDGGLIAGQSAWMSMGEGSVESNTVKAGAAMQIQLGRRSGRVADGSRGLAVQKLRSLFADARDYAKNKAAYNKGQTRKYGASHLDLEALQLVLDGKLPVVVAVDRKSDIATALRLAKEFKLRMILQGATEAWMLADELAAAKVAVIVNPKQNLPESFDEVNVVDDAATRLYKAGVDIIIAPTEDASSVRTLRQLAGLAVGHGLPWTAALAAITTVPAKVFGVDRGNLRVGAAADLVLWTGDPLELSSRASLVMVGGVVQSMVNHQTRLLERYRKRGGARP